jgi:GNAT superfamily N-acetyltransferase
VVAYYTLMPYFIERERLSRKQGRGLPDRIPCYLVARLALSEELQGRRFGSQLLASALARAATGASALGGRYVLVDALDDETKAFYEHHGFVPVPGSENRLLLPTKALDPYLQG